MEPWLEVAISEDVLALLIEFMKLAESEQEAILEKMSYGDDN